MRSRRQPDVITGGGPRRGSPGPPLSVLGRSERPHDDAVDARDELALADAGRRAEAFLELLVTLNRFAGHFVRPLIERSVGESGLEAREELGSDGSGEADGSTGYSTAQLVCAMRWTLARAHGPVAPANGQGGVDGPMRWPGSPLTVLR